MPIIQYVPQDPTDLVIQGEQMRSAALLLPVDRGPTSSCLIEQGPVAAPMVTGQQTFYPMLDHYFVPCEDVFNNAIGPVVSSNGVICTPCGAMVELPFGTIMMQPQTQDTNRWMITGVTRARSGFPLVSCEVIVLEVGQIHKEGVPVVAQTISDGSSGTYSVEVPANRDYWVLAYKIGSPDAGGVSIRTVKPTRF